MKSYTLRQVSKSETFSASKTFKPLGNGMVQIAEWCFDTIGCLPSGTEIFTLPIEKAREEYRILKQHGWI